MQTQKKQDKMNQDTATINRKTKLARWLLAWVATVITALPYKESRSRFLDRLIALVGE
jgi:hypothetical protein